MRETKKDRIFNIANLIFMVIVCLVMLYPVVFVVGRSFMTDVERAMRPFALFPQSPSLSAYNFIFNKGSYIGNAYLITVGRTVIGSLLCLLFTSMSAYVLSRKEYPLKNALTFLVIFTMWFSGGLVPDFLLVRTLGLTNTFWAYIFPGLISAWNMLIMRNFFASIPETVIESARIDGANDLVIYFRIVLPLSGAALATIGLFYAVWHWNSWFDSLMYCSSRSLWTVQLFLREILQNVQAMDLMDPSAVVEYIPPAESVQMATIVVATVPILCVYPFLQKYFVKGVMVGSLKG